MLSSRQRDSTVCDLWPSVDVVGSAEVIRRDMSAKPEQAQMVASLSLLHQTRSFRERRPQPADSGFKPGGSSSTSRSAMSSLVPLLARLKEAAATVDDMIDVVREAERSHSDVHELSQVYSVAVSLCTGEGIIRDSRINNLCVNHMRLLCLVNPGDARDYHNRQRVTHAHEIDARMYEARATLEERLGDTAKAVKMLNEGIRVGAKPVDLLQHCLLQMTESPGSEAQLPAEPLRKQRCPWNVVQALVLSRERQELLSATMAAWKCGAEQSRRTRGDAFVDALQGQLREGKLTSQATELCYARRCRLSLTTLAFSSWRLSVRLIQQRKEQALAAVRGERAKAATRELHRAELVLTLWHSEVCQARRLRTQAQACQAQNIGSIAANHQAAIEEQVPEQASLLDSLLEDLKAPGTQAKARSSTMGSPSELYTNPRNKLDEARARRATETSVTQRRPLVELHDGHLDNEGCVDGGLLCGLGGGLQQRSLPAGKASSQTKHPRSLDRPLSAQKSRPISGKENRSTTGVAPGARRAAAALR